MNFTTEHAPISDRMLHYETEWFDSLVTAAGSVIDENSSISTDEACQKLQSKVPESFTFRQLTGLAGRYLNKNLTTSTPGRPTRQQFTLAVLACLLLKDRIAPDQDSTSADEDTSENEDGEHSLSPGTRLARSIAQAISPVVPQKPNSHSNDLDDSNTQLRAHITTQCLAAADAGFKVLELLASRGPENLDNPAVLVTLIAYTNPAEEWTTPELAARATLILQQHLDSAEKSNPKKQGFITTHILPIYLRPLFSRSSPSQPLITPSGRPSAYGQNPDARPSGLPDDSSKTKPWKFVDLRAITVFDWAVSEADEESTITNSWPLFIPVLLTLADDNSTSVRRRGLVILEKFLDKFPDKILNQTGLNKVFEDTVLPTLSYLPSITPEEESVQLLGPAYAVLRRLAGKLSGEKKNKLLDRVVREGILLGYFHAKEYVRIVEVLCREMGEVLMEMGVNTVKHLKDIIPMLSTILTDPFAFLHPPTLLSAIKALQVVLATCWPRIPNSPWQGEIINSLVLCWLNLHASDSVEDTFPAIRQALIHTADALAAVLATEVEEGKPAISLSEVVEPLVAKEPCLSQLFSAASNEEQDSGLEC
ncbi:hypothetical protein GE21DRAFT_6288 [Neurospora crassa]|uniref:Uncharacterized protein n=1 Tax=Neurospora crassa (strain ATCC 24698 / 74-OR23-1A / CBS 708.71 / DSM 1257 / FGSC 987) TaxID=367110 RepID=Q7S868_NEUCR|nr:hypothetical protein NCU08688 [Neurospora crassa OR74A]EAA32531.3 hypothetical protein NCU08688 [Neurospora crassa OR74A]KHE82859.1 hypothetical protein GE21DRAFT_6288 [Neurospora crassa]|eukprot:XP_961767.3 hypothetical protein NCU08688 [Neurospora crassa OR74A]